MASASTPTANEPAKDLILVHSTAKTNDKNTNLRKNGISHMAIASVHSEKTHKKKCMLILIIIIIITQKPYVW